jgi:GT2 family glycosyltransferase
MALIKYTGKESTVINLNGNRTLIKPNKMFSGPEHLSKYDGFEVLGVSKAEKQKGTLKEKGIHRGVLEYYNPNFSSKFLDNNGKPKVSICIVTKDCNGVIQRCINSIGDFIEYDDIEILICDTGTTDKEVLNYYNFISQDERVQIFTGHEYNFSKNNNFLAEQAKGEVLLFLNNDVFFTYDAVSEMVKYVLCSNIGCVGHRLVWDHDKDLIQHDGQMLYDRKTGHWTGPFHHNYKSKTKETSKTNMLVEGVTAACLMMRKDLFGEAGKFNEVYKDILQDVELNLRVYELGYENVVIRKESLIHVDHASRKGDGTADSPEDIAYFRNRWMQTPFPIRPKPDFSIIVCATNKRQLRELKKSIKSREYYELVFLNNTKNYCSSAQALNTLMEVTEGEYIIMSHQDVTFDKEEPFGKMRDLITKLGPNAGIVGPAGVMTNGKGMRGIDFSSVNDVTFDHLRVQCVDEFCMVTKRSNNLRFNEYLDHFHFYGADICCSAMFKGLRNYALNIPATHHSGGDGNLKKGDGYEQYILQARKFYRYWGKSFPNVATTTAHFTTNEIYYYLGKLLGLTPFLETIDINKDPSEDPPLNISINNFSDTFEQLKFGKDGVSFVILNKDKPEYIKKCVENIQKHIRILECEILIGDTGTTDKEVLSYYEEWSKVDNIKIIKMNDYHFSKNNNLVASKYAKFNRVLFMNNDVFIDSDIIYEMNKCFATDVGIVGLKLYPDNTLQHDGVEMVKSKERNPNEWYLPEHIDYKKDDCEKPNEIVDCVTGACLMMPTRLFKEHGGFEEGYGKVFQDVDLCLRLKNAGYKSMVCRTTSAIHIESGTRDPEINTHDYNLMTERWGKRVP